MWCLSSFFNFIPVIWYYLFEFWWPDIVNFDYLKFQIASTTLLTSLRSSYQRCSIKKGVLRNFTKFTGKHLCQSLKTLAQVYSCEFCEISNNTFLTEHVWVTASTHCISKTFTEQFLSTWISFRSIHRMCSIKKVLLKSFATFFRTPILKNICERLLLSISKHLRNVLNVLYLNIWVLAQVS